MDTRSALEDALAAILARVSEHDGPQGLRAAVRAAVFPGGARIRPRLCLAVTRACDPRALRASLPAACAIELMHCASLVHDDLACFDDAELRRGRPAVHRAYGEPLAVLAGDALIVLAFEALLPAAAAAPDRLARLVALLARATGLPGGIVAGQAWECEPAVGVPDYHRCKTGALFGAATAAGAIAAGHDPAAWHALGERIGLAYQVADDLGDLLGQEDQLGKPVHRDAALGRPNIAVELGAEAAVARLESLIAEASERIPRCAGEAELRAHIRSEATRLVPRELARPAA